MTFIYENYFTCLVLMWAVIRVVKLVEPCGLNMTLIATINVIVPTLTSHRCVSCTQCGATSAGLRCEWQNNYTQCAPCASLASCPLCQQDYNEEEIILQCRQCDRWAAVQHSGSGLCMYLLVCLDSFQLSKSLPWNIIKPTGCIFWGRDYISQYLRRC